MVRRSARKPQIAKPTASGGCPAASRIICPAPLAAPGQPVDVAGVHPTSVDHALELGAVRLDVQLVGGTYLPTACGNTCSSISLLRCQNADSSNSMEPINSPEIARLELSEP